MRIYMLLKLYKRPKYYTVTHTYSTITILHNLTFL